MLSLGDLTLPNMSSPLQWTTCRPDHSFVIFHDWEFLWKRTIRSNWHLIWVDAAVNTELFCLASKWDINTGKGNVSRLWCHSFSDNCQKRDKDNVSFWGQRWIHWWYLLLTPVKCFDGLFGGQIKSQAALCGLMWWLQCFMSCNRVSETLLNENISFSFVISSREIYTCYKVYTVHCSLENSLSVTFLSLICNYPAGNKSLC